MTLFTLPDSLRSERPLCTHLGALGIRGVLQEETLRGSSRLYRLMGEGLDSG